jgi:glycosyltransferase involved in cell wall biosynthesis
VAATRPTILQIIPTLDTGGAELSTVEIASAIVAAGGRALVATAGGRLASRIIAAGGEIIPLQAASKNPARMLSNVQALGALVRRENVDLLHARSRAPAWSTLAAARATKRPFVTTYHGAYAEKGPFKRAYNSVMARGDIVIANSNYTADLVHARYGTPLAKIRVIHRGVDPHAFDPAALSPERTSQLLTPLDIAPGRPIILQAARLTRWKGQLVTLEALSELARTHPSLDWIGVFAGDDQGRTEYRAELERAADKLGLRSRVVFAGHVDDMVAAFGVARVTVIASTDPEAFGRTSIEAQMMGCPVIATHIGAPPETVRAHPPHAMSDTTGWLVPPADPSALAHALVQALTLAPGDRRDMADRARAHAIQEFSLLRMKRATLEVYDALLKTSLSVAFDRISG